MSRIVLITGASSGYGKAIAKAFKDSGDTVIMTARNAEKLEKEIGAVAENRGICGRAIRQGKNSPGRSFKQLYGGCATGSAGGKGIVVL